MVEQLKKIPTEKPPKLRQGKTEQPMVDSIPHPKEPKKSIFRKIWNWFNGKKTLIGFMGSAIGAGLTQVPHWIGKLTGYVLIALSAPLTGVGAIHKAWKSDKVFGKSGEIKLDESTWKTILKLLWAWFSRVIWPKVVGWFGL